MTSVYMAIYLPKNATSANSKLMAKKKTKKVLLVCAVKLSIAEVFLLENLVVSLTGNKDFELSVPITSDETFYFLVHLLSVYGCDVCLWKTSKKEKTDKIAANYLGRLDAAMLKSNYDKIILLGSSTRLDKLEAYLASTHKSYFVLQKESL